MRFHLFLPPAALVLAIGLCPNPSVSAEHALIGLAAPTSGPSAILGEQITAGARQAFEAGADTSLFVADTACSAEGGRAAAERFVARKVRLVVGFLCTESLEAALPVLTRAAIPAIVVGVRADRFTRDRAKTGALVWRVAPPSDAAPRIIAERLAQRWRDVPFGIVDDGSVDGRALSDAVRTDIEAAGLKPALIDAYRPAEEKQFGLARRIEASGVTRLFVAGERPDIAILQRDAAANGLTLEIVGSEALLDEPGAVPLAVGTLAIAPRWRFEALGDPLQPSEWHEGYFGPALVATTIAAEALRQAGPDAAALTRILGATRFETPLGPVGFDAAGDADLDLFRLYRFDGADFVPESGG